MLTSSKNVSETIHAAFHFSVDKFPLSGPDGMQTPWYGLFRSDTSQVVGNGSKTKVYVPHQSEDVIALCDAATEAFDGDIAVSCHFNHGHYVSVEPTRDYRVSIFGEKDNIFPRVLIRAGYDGKAFNASMGYWRDACANMSIMRRVSGTSVSIRHTSGLRSKMDELIATFQTLKESWTTLGDVIARLQSQEVSLSNFLNSVYGLPDANSRRAVTVHRKRTEDIFRRVRRERFSTGRGDFDPSFTVSAWEAYNAVQGYVQHESTRKSGTSDFARILLSNSDSRVKAAEDLVFEAISA